MPVALKFKSSKLHPCRLCSGGDAGTAPKRRFRGGLESVDCDCDGCDGDGVFDADDDGPR